MSRIKDPEYIYAVSRIKTVENRLLSRNDINRMIDSATAEEALKVLTDARYGRQGAENPEARDFERLLAEEGKKLYVLLRSIAPDPQVFDLFLQPHDFHMVKVILKAEFAGIEDFDRYLSGKGSMEAEKLKNMIRERTFSSLPGVMRRAIEEALDDFHHTGDMKAVDFIVDRACFQRMREIAEAFNHTFLKDYVACLADLRNMDIYLRLKPGERNREFLQRVLLPGGYIAAERFFPRRDPVEKELAAELRRTPYGTWAREAAEDYRTGGGLNWLEEAYHEVSRGFIRKGGSKISGLEPLIAYLLRKERELGTVRRIMTGKLNRISAERIREGLGRLYA